MLFFNLNKTLEEVNGTVETHVCNAVVGQPQQLLW